MSKKSRSVSKVERARALVESSLKKWLKPLGLLWWDLTVCFYDDHNDIAQVFKTDADSTTVVAKTYVSWQYGTANVHFNLIALVGMTADKVERIVVHELVHILINEMNEQEQHHEERVVTGLTKAFLWVEDLLAIKEGKGN